MFVSFKDTAPPVYGFTGCAYTGYKDIPEAIVA